MHIAALWSAEGWSRKGWEAGFCDGKCGLDEPYPRKHGLSKPGVHVSRRPVPFVVQTIPFLLNLFPISLHLAPTIHLPHIAHRPHLKLCSSSPARSAKHLVVHAKPSLAAQDLTNGRSLCNYIAAVKIICGHVP